MTLLAADNRWAVATVPLIDRCQATVDGANPLSKWLKATDSNERFQTRMKKKQQTVTPDVLCDYNACGACLIRIQSLPYRFPTEAQARQSKTND